MANQTFCPDDTDREGLGTAIHNAKFIPNLTAQLSAIGAEITTNINPALTSVKTEVLNARGSYDTLDARLSAMQSKCSGLLDLIEQVIYRGSDNVLQLSNAAVTATAGITATLKNGILHIVQDAVSEGQTVTLSGIDISAGTWYFGLSAGAIPLPAGLITAWLKDDLGSDIASTVEGASEPFTVSESITGGSIEVDVSEMLVTDGTDIILYLADKQLGTAVPYFPSLIEVSENA